MKVTTIKIWMFVLFVFLFSACEKDLTADDEIDYRYHAHIYKPLPNVKYYGETLTIDIGFESHSGESIHHINVQIWDVSGHKVIYEQPKLTALDHITSEFRFKDTLVLEMNNGVQKNQDYMIEARIWGMSETTSLVTEQMLFRVE